MFCRALVIALVAYKLTLEGDKNPIFTFIFKI